MFSILKKENSSEDPDYEVIHTNKNPNRQTVRKEEDAKCATIKKISSIIDAQITEEIELKEAELEDIEKSIQLSLQTLDQLRACIVTKYYSAEPNEISDSIAENAWIHPTAKRYTGKYPTCLSTIYDDHDYLSEKLPLVKEIDKLEANIMTKTIPKKEQPLEKTLVQNKVKKNVEIVVGNISKYLLDDEQSDNDQTTHKWMIYVRSKNEKIDLKVLVKQVLFFLHPSYKPNDLVEIREPPFYLCRRGWGEFPIRVQIHFHDPQNKPFDIIHNLKLDKTFTGLQTLGGETIAELPLFVNEYVKSPIKDDKSADTKNIPAIIKPDHEISQKSPENKLIKIKEKPNSLITPLNRTIKIEQGTQKSQSILLPPKGQEKKFKLIVLNDQKQARYFLCPSGQGQSIKGVSILGKTKETTLPSVISEVKKAADIKSGKFGKSSVDIVDFRNTVLKEFNAISRISDYQTLEDYMIELIRLFPLSSEIPYFNHCSNSDENFLSWNIGKQRWAELDRAKEIRKIILQNLSSCPHANVPWRHEIWSRKEIIHWTRECGFVPPFYIPKAPRTLSEKSQVSDCVSLPDKLVTDLQSLKASKTKTPRVPLTESDEEIDVLNEPDSPSLKRKNSETQHLTKCIFFNNPVEDADLVEEVLLQICQSFVSDVLHLSLKQASQSGGKNHSETLNIDDVFKTITSISKFDFLTNKNLGRCLE